MNVFVIGLEVEAIMCAADPAALIRFWRHTSDDVSHNTTLCPGETALVDYLQQVASHALNSFLLEEVLTQKLLESSCKSSRDLTLNNILFIIMSSVDKKERVEWQHQTWLAWVPPKNVVVLADAEIPGYSVTVLPSLPVDRYIQSRFPSPSNYHAANLRHLKAVYWLGKATTGALNNIDWVFMVDDDTFVNVPLLLIYLQDMPAFLPLLFGQIWHQAVEVGEVAWPSGGAGMLFSKKAFMRIAAVLFTPSCEMHAPVNDVIIAVCAPKANVTKIHSKRFLQERITATYQPHVEDVGMVITMHRAVERKFFLDSTCLVSHRFGWPHPLCGSYNVTCNPVCHGK